jgi:DNA-directed RNA polymerase specialized sigma24 family protein
MLAPEVVTNALRRVAQRLPGSVDDVWGLVYPWVVQRAGMLLSGDPIRNDIGEAHDLAHEAYVKLKPAHLAGCTDRFHLIRLATRAMRQVLIDRVRYRRSRGMAMSLELVEAQVMASTPDCGGTLDVALALEQLHKVNPQVEEVASLRLVGGLALVEIARTLRRSEAWARANWELAAGWLQAQLKN